ncbi:hypothetical protein [Kitasatospora sp. HPMI-4]|uniref:hypothetical protein n=1 Tax=Kitasatospora sp. HPMI-4 TaxID=3448443 RepID=UPI003F1AE462
MQPHPHPPFLSDLVAGIPGAVAAIHVSPEGLVTGTSTGVDRDRADKWAAAMAAMAAVSNESVGIAGALTSGEHPWGHSIIEDRHGQNLVLVGSPDHSMLAVVGAKGMDLGQALALMIALADRGLPVAVAA